MSTHARIDVEGSEVCIYKHCDGYPEATLDPLKQFVKDFFTGRGDDPPYFIAQFLMKVAGHEEPYSKPDYFIGWGVHPRCADVGEDYRYTVKRTGAIEVSHAGRIVKKVPAPKRSAR